MTTNLTNCLTSTNAGITCLVANITVCNLYYFSGNFTIDAVEVATPLLGSCVNPSKYGVSYASIGRTTKPWAKVGVVLLKF